MRSVDARLNWRTWAYLHSVLALLIQSRIYNSWKLSPPLWCLILIIRLKICIKDRTQKLYKLMDRMMTKRKFKEIEKNCEKSSQSPNRSNKRLKLSSGTDSERMITLSQKKVKTRLFEKTNLINKDALNKLKFNNDSPKKKFLVKIQVHKPQKPYSLTPKFLKKKKRKEKLIYNE